MHDIFRKKDSSFYRHIYKKEKKIGKIFSHFILADDSSKASSV